MQLSDNFWLSECGRSSTAERCGIENTPPEWAVPKLKLVAENVLQPIRDHFKVPISFNGGLSWWRGPELNTFVNGSPNSQHCKGEAVDIEIAGVSNLELAQWIRLNLTFDQLILEFFRENDPSAGWVHCSYTEDNRNEVLTIGRDSAGKRFTMNGLPS